jgi:hypothetical protein
MEEDFFRRFDEVLRRRHPQAYAAAAAAAAPAVPEVVAGPAGARRMPLWVWIAFGVVVLVALLLLVR